MFPTVPQRSQQTGGRDGGGVSGGGMVARTGIMSVAIHPRRAMLSFVARAESVCTAVQLTCAMLTLRRSSLRRNPWTPGRGERVRVRKPVRGRPQAGYYVFLAVFPRVSSQMRKEPTYFVYSI